jgi:hypothetical protein
MRRTGGPSLRERGCYFVTRICGGPANGSIGQQRRSALRTARSWTSKREAIPIRRRAVFENGGQERTSQVWVRSAARSSGDSAHSARTAVASHARCASPICAHRGACNARGTSPRLARKWYGCMVAPHRVRIKRSRVAVCLHRGTAVRAQGLRSGRIASRVKDRASRTI